MDCDEDGRHLIENGGLLISIPAIIRPYLRTRNQQNGVGEAASRQAIEHIIREAAF